MSENEPALAQLAAGEDVSAFYKKPAMALALALLEEPVVHGYRDDSKRRLAFSDDDAVQEPNNQRVRARPVVHPRRRAILLRYKFLQRVPRHTGVYVPRPRSMEADWYVHRVGGGLGGLNADFFRVFFLFRG